MKYRGSDPNFVSNRAPTFANLARQRGVVPGGVLPFCHPFWRSVTIYRLSDGWRMRGSHVRLLRHVSAVRRRRWRQQWGHRWRHQCDRHGRLRTRSRPLRLPRLLSTGLRPPPLCSRIVLITLLCFSWSNLTSRKLNHIRDYSLSSMNYSSLNFLI